MTVERNFYCVGVLPDRHFRFVVARNTEVAVEIADRHGASPQVAGLLAEALLGAFFLATYSAKDDRHVVSVQLECEGPAHRLLSFATAAGGMRGVPSRPDKTWDGPLLAGKGGGILTVHRWQDSGRRVYSSSVEMRPVAMGRNFQEYLARSDQVQSFTDLEAEPGPDSRLLRCSGYLFQALPGAGADDVDEVLALIRDRRPAELLTTLLPDDSSGVAGGPVATHEAVKVLRTGQFFSYCDCSREKTENMLFLLGKEKVMDLLLERGEVEVFCEFCKKRYLLDAQDIESLFGARPESEE